MKKKLMILGSLQEFVRLTAMAKDRGCTVIVSDGYPNGPAKKIADRAYDVDVREAPSLARYCRQEHVDAIITSFSDLLFENMVKAADLAGLKCYLKPEQLPYYRDKTVMKQLLDRLGIPTPRHVCLSRGFSDQQLEGLRFPVVTKPVDMYGSRGLYVLNSPQEVRRYFGKASSFSRQKKILVEEYNDGYEFNLMAWVLEGKVYILGIADREKTSIGARDIPISTRNIYPSRMISQVFEPAKKILESYIGATGQKNGALSMQFFWAPGRELEVCEIAGRFLGSGGKSLHSRHCRPGKNLHRRQGHPHQHPQHLSLPDDQPGFRAGQKDTGILHRRHRPEKRRALHAVLLGSRPGTGSLRDRRPLPGV